eukprot:XP_001691591.1 predicted protein [Chlamydomonas reinhardtii]
MASLRLVWPVWRGTCHALCMALQYHHYSSTIGLLQAGPATPITTELVLACSCVQYGFVWPYGLWPVRHIGRIPALPSTSQVARP